MIFNYYQEEKNGFRINLKVTPNSSKNEVCGIIIGADEQQFLKLKVAAIADNGKANKELIKFLADEWGVSKADIEIISGKTARNKKILLHSNQLPSALLAQKLINETK